MTARPARDRRDADVAHATGPKREWQNRVVVITGASSGIGRAIALELTQLGAQVVALARREQALVPLAEAATELPGHLEVHGVDVTDAGALRALADDVADRFGRIDAWVNNAAVNLYGPADEPPIEDTQRVVSINLGGYINGTYAALPHMRERGQGVIVNVSSILGRIPAPYQAAYVATKHAIHGWTGSLRQELRVDGIDVCEVAPGPVDTPLFQQAGNYMGKKVVPLSPLTSPERVARAVARSIRYPRSMRIVGVVNAIAVSLSRVSPTLVERVTAWQTAREHFENTPVAASSGNLHRPDDRTPASVTGGWGAMSRPRRRLAIVGASLLGLWLVAGRTRSW